MMCTLDGRAASMAINLVAYSDIWTMDLTEILRECAEKVQGGWRVIAGGHSISDC